MARWKVEGGRGSKMLENKEYDLQTQLHHAMRHFLARQAALQYGRQDDPRRLEWMLQAKSYQRQLHDILAKHWELDPELEALKEAEWPSACVLARKLIA